MLRTKALGILLAKVLIQVLHCLLYLFVAAILEREIGNTNNGIQVRHLLLREIIPHKVSHKEHPALRMIYKIVNIAWFELVQERHCNRSVRDAGKEDHSPVCLILCAYCNLVTSLKATLAKDNMQFLYTPCHIPIIERNTLKI